MEDHLPQRELAPNFFICPILNGLWQMGGGHGKIDITKAKTEMKVLVGAGFTTFDGADHYGPAEDLMGDLWSCLEPGKQNVQLFTKWCPSPGRMTKDVVSKAINESLRKMRTSRLHLIQFHWGDYSNLEYITALKHMQDLQTEGKILHLGLTNFNTKHLKNIVENKIKIASNQVSYSIIDWRPELAMVPYCKQHDIKLLTYGTVLGGFLSNKYLGVERPTQLETSSKKKYMRFIESWGGWQLFQELLQTLEKIGKKHNASISNVATRYILDKPQVGGVILGVRLGLSSHIEVNT